MAKKNNKRIHKIYVDRKACISAATCVVLAPDAFDLDNDSIAVVLDGAEKIDDETLLVAAQSCPTKAIILYD
jgi:ferredoxin